MAFTLEKLNEIILERASASPKTSYTAQLINKGMNECAQKLGEEAVEAVIVAISGDKKELTKEAADVLYHLLVVLKASEIDLADVMSELENRTSQSGLSEKASR
jgi:phosphoribosyl-ATP pyrophosphohydrolase